MSFETIHEGIITDPENTWARGLGYLPLYAAAAGARIVVIGQAPGRKAQGDGIALTETVRAFYEYLPGINPLVHPSPLNFRWQARNPWFVTNLLPVVREHVVAALA